MSLIKSLPTMVKTFRQAIKGFGKNVVGGDRTQQDLSMGTVLGGVVIIAVIMWLVPVIPISPLGALIIVVFGFFFATVSSRMVGIVGSSNNPVSGMAIATLIITTFVFKATGMSGTSGMVDDHCRYGYLYYRSDCRRYITGFKMWLHCRRYTEETADRRTYRCSCFRNRYRRRNVPSECSMGIRL